MAEFFEWNHVSRLGTPRLKPLISENVPLKIAKALLPDKNFWFPGGLPEEARDAIMRAVVGPHRFKHVGEYGMQPGFSADVGGLCLFVFVERPRLAVPLLTVVPGFQLCHAVVSVTYEDDPERHVVCAYRCGDREFVYDSNASAAHEVRWTAPGGLGKVKAGIAHGRVRDVELHYLCFVRQPGSRATKFVVDPARHGVEARPSSPHVVRALSRVLKTLKRPQK
jgi:hypothetical protein